MLEFIKSKGVVKMDELKGFEDSKRKLDSLKLGLSVLVNGNTVKYNHNPIKGFKLDIPGVVEYVQNSNGISHTIFKEDNDGNTVPVNVGNILDGNINNYYVYKDELGLEETKIIIHYYDFVLSAEVEIEANDLEDLGNKLHKYNPVKSRTELVKFIKLLFKENPRERVYASVNGYYLDNEGYLNHNSHPFDGMDSEFLYNTIHTQSKALKEFLEYLERSSGSDVWYKVYKLILLSPFKWFFNSIKYQAGVKSVLLGGEAENGKTDTTGILLRTWYSKDDEVLTQAGSDASLRIELNNYSTLPVLYDEAYKILKEAQETLKQSAFNCNISGRANVNEQGKIMEYKAFHIYYFATNKTTHIFDGFNRRLIYFEFNDELQEVDVEYYNSVLDNQEFNMIGYLFAEELATFYQCEFIKNYDANTLTNRVLEMMVERYDLGDVFDKLIEINPYENTNQSLKYDPDQVCLNSFEKAYHRFIDKQDDDISFADAINKLSSENAMGFKYIPGEDMFKIKDSKLNALIKHYNKGNSVNLTRLYNLREEIEEPVTVEEICSMKISFEPYTVYKYTWDTRTKLKGEPIYPDTYLFSSELIKILFNIQ